MSLDKVAEVFDTTEVPKADADDEDEDVEALMKELYDEAENTKDWCKYQGAEEEAPQEEVEQYVDEPVDYEVYDDQKVQEVYGEVVELVNQAPLQEGNFLGFLEESAAGKHEGNFLGFLEESAAGKHENFQAYDVPTRGWTEELRKTAEAAAANVDAVTSGGLSAFTGGSKKVDVNIQSASRLLAYAVMLTSVITLCAKFSVSRDDVAENASAMAAASQSLSDLKPLDTNQLDPTGEFTAIDEEVRPPQSEEEKKRNAIAEKMHKKHMAELEKKLNGNDKKADPADDEKEETSTPEQEDIKKLLEVSKSLERREKEEGGVVDKDTAAILEAAKSLAAKELKDQKKQHESEKDLDHQVQDDLQVKSAQDKAKHDALKLLKENSMDGSSADIENQVKDSLEETATKQKADNAAAVEARKQKEADLDKKEEAMRKAAQEEEDRLQQKAGHATELAEKKKQDAEDKRLMEIAKEKVAKAKFREEQKQKAEDSAPDTNAQCGAWAQKGECQANAVWMLENCARSCAQHALEDQDPRCSQWADSGECDSNPIYMKHHCPASCGMNAPAPAAADTSGGFARAKRAAGLKKKMKAQQVKDNSKPFIVRGKGLSKAAEEVLDEHDNLQWHGRGAHGHVQYRSTEDNLLDKLSDIPEARSGSLVR